MAFVGTPEKYAEQLKVGDEVYVKFAPPGASRRGVILVDFGSDLYEVKVKLGERSIELAVPRSALTREEPKKRVPK